MKIAFELSQADLEHFREVMVKARENAADRSLEDVVSRATEVLEEVNRSGTSDFIRERMSVLDTLIGMVMDQGWGLVEEDRDRVVAALSYFSEAEDLIPDDIPGLGFLDDAIMVEIVSRELKHEIQAYRDFVVFRASEQARQAGSENPELARSDWLEQRRQQLHSRMRRRRRRGRDGGSRRSPFSMF